ncbi:MAG: caspase domain-containing protein [Granulosicoccus sp.]
MTLWSSNRGSLRWLIAFFVFLQFFNTANASTRHALVIGNSDYDESALLNPRSDAIDMAKQLELMGYEVFGGGPALDLDRIGIERTIRAFARSLPENANALFYFAGHGMATDNDNYLIPVQHRLEFLEQLPDRAVSLKSTINLFKNANPEGINVVLLDACRDSPLARSYRSNREGLQRLDDIPRGVFIGYAADQGQVAKDGQGRNGTYTSELLQIMREQPNVII